MENQYSPLDEIDAIETQIDALEDELKAHVALKKAEIADLKNKANSIATNAVKATLSNQDDLYTLCSELYWLHPLIRASAIRDAFPVGVKLHLPRLVGQGTFSNKCPSCDKEYNRVVNSRSELNTVSKRNWIPCPDCRMKWESERSKSYEESRAEKQRLLDWLRTMPYSEYLKTDHWSEVRKRALKRAGFRCQLCNAQGTLHVHHRTYVNRGQEENSDLIVLCNTCHQEFHEKMELSK